MGFFYDFSNASLNFLSFLYKFSNISLLTYAYGISPAFNDYKSDLFRWSLSNGYLSILILNGITYL